jgi:hypothetical protein
MTHITIHHGAIHIGTLFITTAIGITRITEDTLTWAGTDTTVGTHLIIIGAIHTIMLTTNIVPITIHLITLINQENITVETDAQADQIQLMQVEVLAVLCQAEATPVQVQLLTNRPQPITAVA